jgi:hypothetical protein
VTEKWIGWHFLKDDRRLRWGTEEKVEVGKTIEVDLPLKMCEHGLHASKKPLDALRYAPGFIACKVELSGEIIEESDKACAERRKVLAMADAKTEILTFAVDCAQEALDCLPKKDRDRRSIEALKTTRKYIKGEISRREMRTAAYAAHAAADAAYAAADAAAANAKYNIRLEKILNTLFPKEVKKCQSSTTT